MTFLSQPIRKMGARRAVIQPGMREVVVLLTITWSTDSKRATTQKTVLVRLKISAHSVSPQTGIEPTWLGLSGLGLELGLGLLGLIN